MKEAKERSTLTAVPPQVIDAPRPSNKADVPMEQGPPEPQGGSGKDAMTLGAESREAAKAATEEKEEKTEVKEAKTEPKETKDETVPVKELVREKDRRRTAEAAVESLRRQVAQLQEAFEKSQPKKGEPREEDYQTPEAFQDAQVEYRTQQRLQAEREREAIRQQNEKTQKVRDAHDLRMREAQERFPEIKDIATDPTLPISVAMGTAIMKSKKGPELIMYLHDHRDEAQQMMEMDPEEAIIALGEISARLGTKEVPKTSKAPPPITPVGASERTRRDKYAPDVSDAEYFAQVDEEHKAKVAALTGRPH